jgi:hypothetical protein
MQQPQQEVALPPVFEQFLSNLKQDRKKLLKDKNFGDPKQLQAFVGQYLYPRIEEMFRVLAQVSMEAYGLGASNANEMRRLYYFTVEELQRMGSDVDHDVGLPGVSAEVLDGFQQAFYGLGTLLQEKYPEDQEVEKAFNRCAGFVSEMVAELMQDSDSEYDDEDDDRDEDDSESKGEPEPKAEAKAEPEAKEPEKPEGSDA